MKHTSLAGAHIEIYKAVELYHLTKVEFGGTLPTKMMSQIHNVWFVDFVRLYNSLQGEKRLFMPWELDSDCMTIILRPAPDCIIEITSEPCAKVLPTLKPHINN